MSERLTQLLSRIDDADLRKAIEREVARISPAEPTSERDVVECAARVAQGRTMTTETVLRLALDYWIRLSAHRARYETDDRMRAWAGAFVARVAEDQQAGLRVDVSDDGEHIRLALGPHIVSPQNGFEFLMRALESTPLEQGRPSYGALRGPRASLITIDELNALQSDLSNAIGNGRRVINPPKPLTPLQRKRQAKARHNDSLQAIHRRKRGW
jgi:hypothetical protein